MHQLTISMHYFTVSMAISTELMYDLNQ